MAKKSSKVKSALNDKDNEQILLELIATNTMCTRRAVGVAAKVGMAFLVSSLLVVVAASVVVICNLFFRDKLQVWIPIVASIIGIIAWVSAVIYSVSLLGDLDDTVELVDQNEAEFFDDEEEGEDQEKLSAH